MSLELLNLAATGEEVKYLFVSVWKDLVPSSGQACDLVFHPLPKVPKILKTIRFAMRWLAKY